MSSHMSSHDICAKCHIKSGLYDMKYGNMSQDIHNYICLIYNSEQSATDKFFMYTIQTLCMKTVCPC